METEEKYMARALELARNGRGFTAPNPMVGAVVVAPDGRIIGEGWHRKCGCGHAEVNAIASVAATDLPLLPQSTMYVTLEPCSHYGKTPPCAKLLIDKGIKKVVVGAGDPNEKVAGRGIKMLRDAGIEVVTGFLGLESRELNRPFMTAHQLRRPFITLKWAQSADGFMDWERTEQHPSACRFSTPLTTLSTHRLRANHEAILTTASTVEADSPQMNVRNWDGRQPRKLVVDNHISDLPGYFRGLFEEEGLTSVLVEAGPRFLGALLEAGLWDELRVELSPHRLGTTGRHPAPPLPPFPAYKTATVGPNTLLYFRRP